jgi:hypothetical protein
MIVAARLIVPTPTRRRQRIYARACVASDAISRT